MNFYSFASCNICNDCGGVYLSDECPICKSNKEKDKKMEIELSIDDVDDVVYCDSCGCVYRERSQVCPVCELKDKLNKKEDK